MNTVTCIDKDKNTYEVLASELAWRPSVYGIIIHDEKILLSPQFDGYDLPGGGIELGESLEEALMREVKEETGLDIHMGKVIDTQSSFFRTISKKRFIHSILIYTTTTIKGGELSTDGFDEEEKLYAKMAEWIPFSEIENLKFASSIDLLPIIKKVIS